MTKKDVKLNWKEKKQKAFKELKKRFIIKLVLVILDLDKKTRVETDVSDFAMREVLLMKCEDKRQRLVAYIFKLLNEAKKNYEVHNKEMLAIIRYLETWRYFLKDTKDQFKIWTDHKNLQYFMKAQKLNQKQTR